MRGINETNIPTEQYKKEEISRISRKNGDEWREKSNSSEEAKGTSQNNCRISLKFQKRDKLLSSYDYARLRQYGMCCNGAMCRFFYIEENINTRLGITVSKKFGKANQRNQFKRWSRELFRLSKHLFPKGIEINIAPRLKLDKINYWQIRDDFKTFTNFIKSRAVKSS